MPCRSNTDRQLYKKGCREVYDPWAFQTANDEHETDACTGDQETRDRMILSIAEIIAEVSLEE
jgi:hypothetical protein